MSENPYQPPAADPVQTRADPREVSTVVLEHLRCTRPWVKFCSLLGFITAGFILFFAVWSFRNKVAMGTNDSTHALLLGGFQIVLALLFIFPSVSLSKYERSITRLMVSLHNDDLEIAISYQRFFWRQIALMILIVTLIFLVLLFVSIQ